MSITLPSDCVTPIVAEAVDTDLTDGTLRVNQD